MSAPGGGEGGYGNSQEAATVNGKPSGSTLGTKMEGMSAGFDALGAVIDGYNAAANLKRQASVATANAVASNQNAAIVADSILRQGRASLGAQSASVAENGLGFSGSVLDTIGQSAVNVQADVNKAIYGGGVKAIEFQNEASAARAGAKNAVTGGWIAAGSKLITGVGKAMTMGGG
ncbi:MAG: hypothetical protein JWP35_4673 [Caulobacter sp.]|nr:hypothetical protein [Caulobacter sp.]